MKRQLSVTEVACVLDKPINDVLMIATIISAMFPLRNNVNEDNSNNNNNKNKSNNNDNNANNNSHNNNNNNSNYNENENKYFTVFHKSVIDWLTDINRKNSTSRRKSRISYINMINNNNNNNNTSSEMFYIDPKEAHNYFADQLLLQVDKHNNTDINV